MGESLGTPFLENLAGQLTQKDECRPAATRNELRNATGLKNSPQHSFLPL